jgi:hypothetical protein
MFLSILEIAMDTSKLKKVIVTEHIEADIENTI